MLLAAKLVIATATDAATEAATTAADTGEDVMLERGPLVLTRDQLDGLIAGAGRILLVIIASWIVVRVLHRLVDRAVVGVTDPRSSKLGRLLPERDLDLSADEVREDEISLQRRSRRAVALASVGKSTISVAVWTLSVFTILSTVGIELGPYIAGLGIVGVALGFGAQDLVKDFISGVFMLLEDQYGVGDQIDSGEAVGTVESVSLRTTRIRSVDGTLWYVPNGEIRRLGNMSQEWARTLLDIGVSYGTDTDHASAVIAEVANTMAAEPEYAAMFLDEPTVWGVQNLGVDAVDIRLVIKTTPGDQYGIGRELRRRLKYAFDREGIEIPFPQRTMWIRREDGEGTPSDGDAVS